MVLGNYLIYCRLSQFLHIYIFSVHSATVLRNALCRWRKMRLRWHLSPHSLVLWFTITPSFKHPNWTLERRWFITFEGFYIGIFIHPETQAWWNAKSRQDDYTYSKVCLTFTSESQFTVPGCTEGEYSAADDGVADVCLNKKQNNDEGWAMFSMLMDVTDAPVCRPLPTTLWEIHLNDI